jgi:hypothetical protein
MAQRRHLLAVAAVLVGGGLFGWGSAARADGDAFCKWGGDNGQSMKCFDCIKREWTGHEWTLVNTCPPQQDFFIFGGADWR